MNARTLELTVSSSRKQDITFIVRFGIEAIKALYWPHPLKADAADCVLHLPAGKPVTIDLKLGSHKPIEWVDSALSA